MNVWTFIGRVGRDAETRSVGGDKVTSFSVAVDQGYGDKKTTMWVNSSIWGERGSKVAGYIKKGDMIGVTGEAQLRIWDKADGTQQTSLECRVNDVQLLGGKGSDRGTSATSRGTPSDGTRTTSADLDDEIPF